MSGINDIVNVTITRETVVPVGLAFGWVNFVSELATFTPRVKIYGSPEEIAGDATAGADAKAFALKYFGQEIRPTRLYVTKKDDEDESYVQALDLARIETDEWYGVTIDSVTAVDQLAVAAWTESKQKIFMARVGTADVIDGADSDDVASVLQDNSYLRTAVFYHHTPAVFPEAGIMGLQLPKKPGSSQWAYKTIRGIPASPLTDGQRTAAFNKNVNVFTDRSNINVFEQGRTASGEWIDTTINIDWLTSRIQNRVYTQLVNNEKIPYTDDGVNVIVNGVAAVLEEAVVAGILASDPAPTVTAPLVANIDSNTKGARILPDVAFRATLAGAIIKAEIVGRVEL